MRFWLSRDASIPIREQLSAQIILGIVSRRYPPGQKLPSVRELARRLKIHANTVSAAYQDLAERGWVARRAGAGVFVSDRIGFVSPDTAESFARACVRDGLAHGHSLEHLRQAFEVAFTSEKHRGLVVIDPDAEMARILAAEISEAIGVTVEAVSGGDAGIQISDTAIVLATEAYIPALTERTRGLDVRAIGLKSMEEVLAGQQRPTQPVLIAVASRSESILRWASTLLSALGFPPDAVVLRNACLPDWKDGLHACDLIAVDVVASPELPDDMPKVVFRIVSEAFLGESRSLVTDAEL
jgi:GntR family transcriptional regulator